MRPFTFFVCCLFAVQVVAPFTWLISRTVYVLNMHTIEFSMLSDQSGSRLTLRHKDAPDWSWRVDFHPTLQNTTDKPNAWFDKWPWGFAIPGFRAESVSKFFAGETAGYAIGLRPGLFLVILSSLALRSLGFRLSISLVVR